MNEKSRPLVEKLQLSDKIVLADIVLYGYHGVMPEEGKIGCRFRIDLTCGLDFSHAAATDDVDNTISYDLIFNTTERAFSEKRFKLIEALSQHIVDSLFDDYPAIDWINIRVAKPEAPIPVVKGEFAVEITRERT